MAQPSPVRRRMIEDMTARNLSPATQQSYLYAVPKFSRFFGRSPRDKLDENGLSSRSSRYIPWSWAAPAAARAHAGRSSRGVGGGGLPGARRGPVGHRGGEFGGGLEHSREDDRQPRAQLGAGSGGCSPRATWW